MAHRRIGIDLGATCVRVAEVETAPGRRPHLTRFGEHAVPPGTVHGSVVADPRPMSVAIRGACRAGHIKSNDAVLGVGGDHAHVRPVTLPAAPRPQLRASLPYLVQDDLPVPVAECVLDFLPVRQHGDEVSGLLVAVSEAAASAAVRAAEGAGLRVVGVDLAAFGLLRGAMQATDPVVTAVVDVGADGMQIVVAEHAQPQLVRYGSLAAGVLVGDVARALHVDEVAAEQLVRDGTHPDVSGMVAAHAERMAMAVVETLGFHAQSAGRPAEAILLTGRGAMVPGFGQCLATLSRLPVTLPRPETVFDLHPRVVKTHPVLAAWTVAGGLALGGTR